VGFGQRSDAVRLDLSVETKLCVVECFFLVGSGINTWFRNASFCFKAVFNFSSTSSSWLSVWTSFSLMHRLTSCEQKRSFFKEYPWQPIEKEIICIFAKMCDYPKCGVFHIIIHGLKHTMDNRFVGGVLGRQQLWKHLKTSENFMALASGFKNTTFNRTLTATKLRRLMQEWNKEA